nr:hypothetical protein [Tanacetum cinerariifolium]
MREKGIDTWNEAQTHMVLLGECFGTVQVGCRCTVYCCGGEGYLVGKLVKGQFAALSMKSSSNMLKSIIPNIIQELDVVPGLVVATQKTYKFLKETQAKHDERPRQVEALVRETEARARERYIFIEKLKGNRPF